jgi:DNA-directed RNA polymerase subunit RPC12/RpoP
MTRILKYECAHCGGQILIRRSYTVGLGNEHFENTGIEVRGLVFPSASWPQGEPVESAVSYLCTACTAERETAIAKPE